MLCWMIERQVEVLRERGVWCGVVVKFLWARGAWTIFGLGFLTGLAYLGSRRTIFPYLTPQLRASSDG
jgi:hypothetical protein